MTKFIVAPSNTLTGEIRVASDKSISHRAVLLSSLVAGETVIRQVLSGDDVLSTIAALRACGVDIAEEEKDTLRISASGELTPPSDDINCGNSGTLMRLFCGVAAGWRLSCRLVGDESLGQRPMRRVAKPLADMGADIEVANKGTPPIIIRPTEATLHGILYSNQLSSAQVKSAILLAGLRADGSTIVAESVPSRDHTERMLEIFGAKLRRSEDGRIVEVMGGSELRSPGELIVPADISSAMFFLVAAAISLKSDVLLTEVGMNPTRTGGLELLLRMGADIDIQNRRNIGAEPVADIRVRGGELHGTDITAEMVPSAIDDLPALLIAAATARGATRLSGAEELRHKESDRLSAMVNGLKALGVKCEEHKDGVIVTGNTDKRVFSGGEVDSVGDHRIAMSFCMASVRAKDEIIIDDCDNVRTSFPNFVKMANTTGVRVVEEG